MFSGTSSGYAGGSYLTTNIDLDGVCDDVSGGTTGCAGADVRFQFTSVTDCNTIRDGWFLDDVTVTADIAGACTAAPDPVSFFSVTSRDEANELVWVNPASGGSLTVAYRTDRFPTGPADGSQLFPPAGTPDAKQTFSHQPLTNGTTYYYGAYVGTGLGDFSAGRFTSGRPQDVSGRTAWIYQTGATSVVPPAVSAGIVWAVSNDRILHSMVGGPSGGSWPPGYMPQALNATQARPPGVPISLAGASQVLFAGTLDGDIYALDANTGSTLWSNIFLAERFQGSPTAMLSTFGGAYDLVFAGTRNTSSDNELIALRLSDGIEARSFDNGGSGNAIGIISGAASIDYTSNRIVFASRAPAGKKYQYPLVHRVYRPERVCRVGARDRRYRRKPRALRKQSLRRNELEQGLRDPPGHRGRPLGSALRRGGRPHQRLHLARVRDGRPIRRDDERDTSSHR